MEFYKLSETAEEDLIRLWLFGLEQFGERQADQYYFALIQHIETLARNPLLFPVVDHIRVGYRRSVCGVHSIYYRQHDSGYIEIMRIIHKQDF